ncbi:contact-dependent growth inhibition system immunity protein [Micromonospora sp. NBC_01405]|uniref:contact-dependent growth inhibition system immunity protein n=1 Tax=Micromonospora sp. NBC_01405 TaxID=2903589 RepID=UPI00324F943F
MPTLRTTSIPRSVRRTGPLATAGTLGYWPAAGPPTSHAPQGCRADYPDRRDDNEQLERDVWQGPDPDNTFLVRRCTELRRKRLAEFTVEDLRIVPGQEIGVPALLPLAVQVLLSDPMAEGDYYHPGDLLSNVLRLPDSAWSNLRAERKRLASVAGQARCWSPVHRP